jgi:hypothetical protein
VAKVDVVTEALIAAPPDVVADFAGNPENAPKWYKNIKEVKWLTPPPLEVGSQLAFVAEFLGRTLSYTYVVTELEAGRRLVMKTAEGPFPMETTYEWTAAGGMTRMTLRNRGSPSGFASIAAPFMSAAMRRENRKDLAELKRIVELGFAPK